MNPPTPWIGSAINAATLPLVDVWITSSTSRAHAMPQVFGSSFSGQR